MRLATISGIASLVLGAVLLATPAPAAQLLSETFPYSDGDITTVSGGLWVIHSGSGGFVPQVTSGEVFIVHGSGSREDVNRGFPRQGVASKTYACLDVRVPTGPAPTFETYFAHFIPSINQFNFRSRLHIAPEPTGRTFTFGISVTSTGSSPLVSWPGALNFDETYKLVHSYDAATGTSELWVNPVNEASPKVVSVLASAGGEEVDSYALRQSGGSSIQVIDNITVGQSFDDVCDTSTPSRRSSWGRLKALYR